MSNDLSPNCANLKNSTAVNVQEFLTGSQNVANHDYSMGIDVVNLTLISTVQQK